MCIKTWLNFTIIYLEKLFLGVEDLEQAEIKRATDYVRTAKYTDLMKAPIGGAQKGKFKTLFKETYTGTLYRLG